MESKEVKPECCKKGLWKPEEDLILKKYVETHGEGNWAIVSEKSGLSRGGKSCRLRWKNYLQPNIKHGGMSEEEQDLIIRMHKLLGNRWSLIAGRLPGRTDNEVKNYWNTHLNKNSHGCKRKTLDPNNRQHDIDNKSQTKKKLRQSQNSETTSNACSIRSIERLDGRKEEAISSITNPWIENAKSFKCEIESLLAAPNSEAFLFDNELLVPNFDSLIMFEALGCIGEETYSQYYMNSTFY